MHIAQSHQEYVKPLLPCRRIPVLPPYSVTDRTVMETDWESMYRSWKEGYGWRNRLRMFSCCEIWLVDLQKTIWADREMGTTANYVVTLPPMRHQQQENIAPQNGNEDVAMAVLGAEEDEDMIEMDGDNETPGGLEQFQWP